MLLNWFENRNRGKAGAGTVSPDKPVDWSLPNE